MAMSKRLTPADQSVFCFEKEKALRSEPRPEALTVKSNFPSVTRHHLGDNLPIAHAEVLVDVALNELDGSKTHVGNGGWLAQVTALLDVDSTQLARDRIFVDEAELVNLVQSLCSHGQPSFDETYAVFKNLLLAPSRCDDGPSTAPAGAAE